MIWWTGSSWPSGTRKLAPGCAPSTDVPVARGAYLAAAATAAPGTGQSKLTAYWVLMVLAVSRTTQHRYLLALERWKGLQIDDHKNIIRRVYRQHRWSMCHVEKNNVQSLLLAEYEKTGAPFQLIQTGASKHFELEVMGSEFARGLWHLPSGNARVQEFIAELKAYPT